MTQSYFGEEFAHQNLQGLGTTSSYITPGGQPQWRPTRAWTYVVTIHPQSSPFGTGRTRLWGNSAYTLWKAPEVDVTPYGQTWYPKEADGAGVFERTSGNIQLVVSNRSSRDRTVKVRMKAASYGVDRTLTVGPEGQPGTTFTLPTKSGLRPIAVPLRIPAHSAAGIVLTSDPGPVPAPAGDPRTLSLRVQDVTVADA